jgi:hypothetical protein
MGRVVRITVLTAVLAGSGWILGLGGLAGAQNTVTTTSYGIDCGSDQVVTIINESYIVPGERQGPAPTSRQALSQFLRKSGVRIRGADFRRAGGGEGAGLHTHRRDGKRVATAYVAPIGDTFHVPNIVACDRLASGGGED